MNTTIKKSVKKKNKLFKRYLETRNSWHYHEYVKIRNKTTHDIKNAKYKYEKNIASKCKENPKSFWAYVNSVRKCGKPVSALEKEDGTFATSDSEKADILNKFFVVYLQKKTCQIYQI